MKQRFIVQINAVGWLTLAGLALDLAAFLILVDLGTLAPGRSLEAAGNGEHLFFLAVSLMYLGMLADAFDGIVARRFGLESEFGRYLDGFVDVFNYLVVPNLALWRLGFDGPWAGCVLGAMIACGVLRLSKFNMIGNIKDEKGERKYLGLPVFWSQLLFFPLYLLFPFVGESAFSAACAAAWIAMSTAFVYNRPFFKPKNPWVIAGITTALSAGALALFLLGRHPVKTLCLFNPKAGRFNFGDLERAFRDRVFWGGVEYHALGPEPGAWADRLADGDKAVVLGGDGTIHHVIQRLAFRKVEVSVVPAGTANDLGYCLGVSGGLRASIDLLERGRSVAYDTIAVNGRHVITGGGFGLGFLAAASANRLRAGSLGFLFRALRAKIYLLTLGWHGTMSPPPREPYRASVDGRPSEGVTQSILFCNQALMGKRVLIAPGTTGTDGRFHLVEFLHRDTRGILKTLAGLKAGTEGPHPLLKRGEAEQATLEFDRPVPAYGDGEEFAPQRRWDLVCHRGSVTLRVPAGFGTAAPGTADRGRAMVEHAPAWLIFIRLLAVYAACLAAGFGLKRLAKGLRRGPAGKGGGEPHAAPAAAPTAPSATAPKGPGIGRKFKVFFAFQGLILALSFWWSAGLDAFLLVLFAVSSWEVAALWRSSPSRQGYPFPYRSALAILSLFALSVGAYASLGPDLGPGSAGTPAGRPWLASVFLLVAVFDGFSQIFGEILGGPKMVPTISPGKTWSGFAGGLAACMAVSLLGQALIHPFLGAGPALVAGAAVGVLAFAGDITASKLKRRIGVKDFSNLLGPQGGVLDRADSLLWLGPGLLVAGFLPEPIQRFLFS